MNMRHLVRSIVQGGVCFIISTNLVFADVYLDKTISLQDNTDSLVAVLSESVVPGGVRRVSLNGNEILVKRFANPSGDNSAFYETWKNVAAQKKNANNEILSVVNEDDPVWDMVTKKGPYRPVVENIPLLLTVAESFGKKRSEKVRRLVIDAVETPFAYETINHRVIASIPIKAIDAESTLAENDSDDGYLFLSEKSPDTTQSSAFWQLQFDENFTFSDIFGQKGQDVNGQEPDIARYPGSVMSMAYSENANEWNSKSWSYESTGDVLSHITHYISAFDRAGFSKESKAVVHADYGLIQFANAKNEATLFVEKTEKHTHDIQITLQVRSN